MSQEKPAQVFSRIALVVAFVMGGLYALAVLSGLFAFAALSGGLGLILAVPVAIFAYIFVALVVQRWRERDTDPYADLEE